MFHRDEPETPDSFETQYPGRQEALDLMFDYSDTVALEDTRRRIRAIHAGYPPDKPKAAVFILAYPIHCGVNCESPNARRKHHIRVDACIVCACARPDAAQRASFARA